MEASHCPFNSWASNRNSSVARGGNSIPPIGLESMQNRTVSVLFRPMFAQKMKTIPLGRDLVTKLWRICRDSCGRTVLNFGEDLLFLWRSPVFGQKNRFNFKIRLNFGEDFFFWRSPVCGRKNRFNFRFPPKNLSQFRINRLNLIRKQWKFGSRSLTVVSLFQKSPPSFSKSWLRAWTRSYEYQIFRSLVWPDR